MSLKNKDKLRFINRWSGVFAGVRAEPKNRVETVSGPITIHPLTDRTGTAAFTIAMGVEARSLPVDDRIVQPLRTGLTKTSLLVSWKP